MGTIILFFIRCFVFLYAIQPRRLQLFWGGLLGFFLRLLQIRRKIVEQNLLLAYPKDAAIREEIFAKSYTHLGNLLLEALLVFGPLDRFVKKYAKIEGLENLQKAKSQGKGVIFLASHLGNWEIMAAAGGVIAQTDLMMVTKKLKPSWLHDAIERGRLKCGVSATYEPKTWRDILTHLKRNGTIGFVLDQYAGPPVGVRVPFFGVPVGTTLALATLVKRTGAALVPVVNYRKPDGRWHIQVSPALEWEKASHSDAESTHYELVVNTARYVSFIEKSILETPSQWLWTHRRFKGDLTPIRSDEWKQPRTRR